MIFLSTTKHPTLPRTHMKKFGEAKFFSLRSVYKKKSRVFARIIFFSFFHLFVTSNGIKIKDGIKKIKKKLASPNFFMCVRGRVGCLVMLS